MDSIVFGVTDIGGRLNTSTLFMKRPMVYDCRIKETGISVGKKHFKVPLEPNFEDKLGSFHFRFLGNVTMNSGRPFKVAEFDRRLS